MAKTNSLKNPFTPDELKTLSRIFHGVWDYIACDMLQLVQEMDGKDYMSRDEVIEVTLDANRPLEHARTPEEKALVKRFDALDMKLQNKIAKTMFTYSKYGM